MGSAHQKLLSQTGNQGRPLGTTIVAETADADGTCRTVLICHADDAMNLEGLARWLAATTTLVGIVVLDEPARRIRRRIQREIKRVGLLRFIDVLAFRYYYKLFMARRDRR